MNSVNEVMPGVWLLNFPIAEEMIGAKCTHLVPPLVEASKKGKLVLIAVVAPELRIVDMSMPTFWLDAFTKKGVKVKAMGVVTKAAAVRVAVKGFHLAMQAVGAPLEAQTFADTAAAIAWSKTLVEARTA